MEKKLEDKRIRWIVLGALAVFFIATRLFRLDMVPFGPHGMHIDEAEAAYDAVCIRDWGVDQFLVRFPPYFRGYGGGQNALYTYLSAIVFKILPVSIFSFRLTAVICAIPAFFAMYDLASRLFEEKLCAFASILLMTIMPVYLMSEHWGLECYLFLSLAIISMDLMVIGINKKSILYLVLSGVFWGITLYTYAITWIVVPVYLVTVLFYLIYSRSIRLKEVLSLAIPTVLLGIPLFIQLLVMTEIIAPFSLPFMDFFPTDYYRNESIGFSYIWENLKHTTYVLIVADDQIYNSTSRFGLMYYVAVPFLIIGFIAAFGYFIRSIREKKLSNWGFIVLFYIVGRFVTLITFEPNTNRMSHIYLPFLLYIILGIRWVISKIKYKKTAAVIISAAFGISFLLFAKYFYSWSGFGQDSRASMMRAPTQMGETLAEIEKEYGESHKINVIANDGYANPLMFALFTETSPYDFNEDRIKGCSAELPEELDLSGETVYFIDNEIGHITDYLETVGFTADRERCEGFAVVVK